MYLFRALEIISKKIPVKCIIIGRTENQFQPYFDKHKHLFTHYEHIAHHELGKYYNQASLFVFPSLDEGMALVQLEAMACGLPIICTTNSGGDSAVTDGIEGCVVPIRNAEAIAEKVISLYKNPELLKEMSSNAHLKAQEFTWDKYGEKLATFIKSL
ncbi:glycosyltransferase family 4 protein [Pedobacter agri]|uniref:glycosyltransferase family 4 protein n=1 Tax=Pedobacter agri TaxID=454586 RepID=UPI001EE641FE|nr:glycosyltransferase family 4 protein [Pedobacter agri]